jgi:alpha-L-fucosidase 2
MLIQSHTGVVRIFPAVPEGWKEISFRKLRAEGAFIVSAVRSGGELKSVKIVSEKGGRISLFNSFTGPFKSNVSCMKDGDLLIFDTSPGQEIIITPGE